MASTGDVELRNHVYQVLRRPWEITGRDDEIDKKFRNNESMQCVRRLQVAWKIQKWKKINDSGDGRPCVVKMIMNDI